MSEDKKPFHNPFAALDWSGRYHIRLFLQNTEDVAAAEAVENYRSRYCSPGTIDLRLYELSPRISLKQDVAS